MFNKYDKFTWWMPKNMVRMTLYGEHQTKLQWMLGTWKIYIAYWQMHIAFIGDLLEQAKRPNKPNSKE